MYFIYTMNKNTDSALVFDNMNVVYLIECNNVYIMCIKCNNLNTVIHKKFVINIFTVNICSLKKYYDELCIILDNVETKFEVIVLTEAFVYKIQNISINNFLMDGYTVHSTTNNKNQNNCVIVFLKDTLNDISVTEINIQALKAFEITFKFLKIDSLIYTTYRSPNDVIETALYEINDTILHNYN